MAEKDIIQNMIFQLGQSQNERMPKELGIHHADVDERSSAELLRFSRRLAALVSYFRSDVTVPDGEWSAFFPGSDAEIKKVLENRAGDTSPHLALFIAFLELYKIPQEVINRFTGRHLDFYYQQLLRFVKKGAVPDRAHLLLELKKHAPPLTVGPDQRFLAGKDTLGRELCYIPTRTTLINSAKVDSLRSLYVDSSGHGRVLSAPVANSADGLGGALTGDEPKWSGFGHSGLPTAETGFALASPLLRMREGNRTVTATLSVGSVNRKTVNNTTLKDSFEIFISGEKRWLGPYAVSPTLSEDVNRKSKLTFSFSVPDTEPAVIDYDPLIHGSAYNVAVPVVQLLLKKSCSSIGYTELKRITLLRAAVSVTVTNVTTLALENDGGTLDSKKAFLPFGSQPTKGSRFMIACSEALAKKLSEVTVAVTWKDAPPDFSSYYADYSDGSLTNDTFTATVSFGDGGSWDVSQSGVKLFESGNASAAHTFSFKVPQEPRRGFITFALEHDFLHSTYRKKYVEKVMAYSRGDGALIVLNEPYTPAIRSISLSYTAVSDTVTIAQDHPSIDDYINQDLSFHHITYFGQMREHAYQRTRIAFLRDKNVYLFPHYDNEGELLIGFAALQPGESVSVLFQVAEGSADPELPRQQINWSVLCDNYWKPLAGNELLLDTTNQLLTSGIVTFGIPAEATVTNTILPGGRIWVKGAVYRTVSAVSRLIDVAANALEVQFTNNVSDNVAANGKDPGHLHTALEKGSITKLKNGSAEIKTVRQPYGSFGGRPPESDDLFHTRVSERLRHKDRCITPWDYERIILEEFPSVHKVKCIPHASSDCWLKPGNVLIVVVADLKNRNAVNQLEPKVPADTLSRITAFAGERAGMQVRVQTRNPRYQKVQLDFKVRFYDGREPHYYRKELDSALITFLSPWAYQVENEISFGGRIYKSVLLDFVEELEYVDYVTDFKMYCYFEDAPNRIDVSVAQPETPDTILVSAASHSIREV